GPVRHRYVQYQGCDPFPPNTGECIVLVRGSSLVQGVLSRPRGPLSSKGSSLVQGVTTPWQWVLTPWTRESPWTNPRRIIPPPPSKKFPDLRGTIVLWPASAVVVPTPVLPGRQLWRGILRSPELPGFSIHRCPACRAYSGASPFRAPAYGQSGFPTRP